MQLILQLAQNQMNQPSMEKLNCADCEGTSDWIPCKISNSNESICYATCPLCKKDLVQCRLCTYNFIENNNRVVSEGYMMIHLKQKHNIAAQKRQKTSGVSEHRTGKVGRTLAVAPLDHSTTNKLSR